MPYHTKKVNLTSANISFEQLQQLQHILPEALSENKIDWDKLRAVLGDHIDQRIEKFGFTWAGKSNAIKNVLTPSTATLAPAKNEGIKFDESENLFIEGDNLEVLKLLQKAYFEKVKMIYIDPPYNTGGDFVYHDNFAAPVKNYLQQTGQIDGNGNNLQTNRETNGRYHSDWLTMMYPRLKLAWNLLRDDGVIFVSIDDHEVAHLRMLLDEVFGDENCVAQIPWKGKGGGADNKYLMAAHEYILMYAKNIQNFIVGGRVKENEKYPKFDELKQRHYKTQLARKWGSNSRRQDRPNLYYPITAPDGTEAYPKLPMGAGDGCWRWALARMQKEIAEGNVEFVKENNEWIVYEKIWAPQNGEVYEKKFSTWLDYVGNTAEGTKELQEILGSKSFDFPKPTSLIQTLLKIGNVQGADVVLDFFAGSGTTAHAVLKQNQENKENGKRKFILVQLPEATEPDSEAYKAGYKTIADITKERIRRVIKGYGDNPQPIADGFKVFKLAKSNYPENNFEFDPEKTEAENKKAFGAYLAQAKQTTLLNTANDLDVVYENVIKEGFSLNAKIGTAQIGKNKVYSVADGERSFVVCLDKKIDTQAVKELTGQHYKGKLFICLDTALDDTGKANVGLNIELKTI